MAESGARVRIPRDRENDSARLAARRAAVVLAGEASRAAAGIAGDWVPSHDQLARTRP